MKSHILSRRNHFDLFNAIKFILLIAAFICFAIPISVGIAAAEASSPSFNCQKDNLTSVEKIICSDSELAALDAEMSRLFESVKKGVPDKEKQDFIVDQRQWLKQRDISCKIKKDTAIIGQAQEEKKTCLKNLYQARIKDLKTSSSDEWEAALKELARRIPTAGDERGYIDTEKLGFTRSVHTEDITGSIKKQYVLTKSQIAEISAFNSADDCGESLYLEDVDQDRIKDIIIERRCGKFFDQAANEYLYYHVNSDKTLTKMKGPDTSEDNNFVQLNNKTYIAVFDSSPNHSKKEQPHTVIKLFSIKSESGRKGIGKIQVDYSSYFKGQLVKGNNTAFHVLEEKADAMVLQFEQKDSPPLANSLMNNPAWTYKGKDVKKIIELISEEYGTEDFLKNESQCQLLDIDNDGKEEIVCQMAAKSKDIDTKYSRMIIVKMGSSGTKSYIDVDNEFPEVENIEKLYDDFCNIFLDLKFKGSEYFPLSDGKENYIVKIGKGWRGNHQSDGYILGIYKLKGRKIELVDAMAIKDYRILKDVTVSK